MKYNWKSLPQMQKLIERVQASTKANINPLEKHMANEYCDDFEEFIALCIKHGYINRDNIKHFYKNLSKLKTITVLPQGNRGIYGYTTGDKSTVMTNPSLDRDRRKLYLFHELGHIVLSLDHSLCQERLEHHLKLRESQGLPNNDIFYAGDGLKIIEEALVQNLAETLLYDSKKQARPIEKDSMDKAIPDIKFKTNFDFYGLYQSLVGSFGKTLRFVPKTPKDTPSELLNKLTVKAFYPDFTSNIINEYENDIGIRHLFLVLNKFGIVFNSKLNSFGYGYAAQDYSPTNARKAYLDAFSMIERLKDYRPTSTTPLPANSVFTTPSEYIRPYDDTSYR